MHETFRCVLHGGPYDGVDTAEPGARFCISRDSRPETLTLAVSLLGSHYREAIYRHRSGDDYDFVEVIDTDLPPVVKLEELLGE